MGLLSYGSVPAEEVTLGWQSYDLLQIWAHQERMTWPLCQEGRRHEPSGRQDSAGLALWHFKYTSCLSGEKSEAGALSCSPQETLKPNCCSQQLLRADPDPYSASSWLLSVNR